MKKICIISPAVYPLLKENTEIQSAGGAEAQFKALGGAFTELGYEVHYIVDDYGQSDTEKIDKITTHKNALKYLSGANYYIIPAWINFWRILLMIRANIHIIKVPRDLILPLGLFCKLFNKKLIFVGQTDADVDPVVIRKMANIFSYWFFRLGMMLVDYVVAQNEKQKKGFIEIYNKQSVTITNVITLPEAEAEAIVKKDYILWVGNSSANKQPEKFLELVQRLPQYNFKMIMSLTWQNSNDNFIRDQLPTIPNLEYLGFVPFPCIAVYFQRASLFVSTSLREGFPNTFLQAWQYSTPVVSLHVDPDGLINRFMLGRHAKRFDKLIDDTKELMEDEKLRSRIGENAKEYVEKNHSLKRVSSQYHKLFEALNGLRKI